MAQARRRRKPAPIEVVKDRALVNFTDLARNAPSEAARAYWARKAEAARAALEARA